MISRWNVYFVSIILCLFCINPSAYAKTAHVANKLRENDQMWQALVIQPDVIARKQKEMRNTVVLIKTRGGTGSGTIIDCLETDTEGVSEYRILTNAHVVGDRFVTVLREVNSLTGRIKTETIDTGCAIIVFDHNKKETYRYHSEVIDEDSIYDLAILSFQTEQKIDVARIADDQMLKMVRVFDEVFAVGCPFGNMPSPTTGIISRIITGKNGEKEWAIYNATTQIVPGSSGGGLFKKYNDHYYLIGIPFSIATTRWGQIVPHLSRAIAISTARDFIDKNTVTCP
jgi:S1-C subfamily serine protease